jgi:hypothetical protein
MSEMCSHTLVLLIQVNIRNLLYNVLHNPVSLSVLLLQIQILMYLLFIYLTTL